MERKINLKRKKTYRSSHHFVKQCVNEAPSVVEDGKSGMHRVVKYDVGDGVSLLSRYRTGLGWSDFAGRNIGSAEPHKFL